MKRRDREDFEALIRELSADPRAQKMKEYIQHGTVTTFDHSMDVARTSFSINRKLHLRAPEKELVTAAFLHDYFLYDWHDHGDRLHGYHHPDIAADNAARDFAIGEKEADAIRSHMWPLTITRTPRSRIAWIVTLADKLCSTRETIMERHA